MAFNYVKIDGKWHCFVQVTSKKTDKERFVNGIGRRKEEAKRKLLENLKAWVEEEKNL